MFSTTRLVVENEDDSITKDDVIRETNLDKTLSLVVDIVRQEKLSKAIKKTPSTKVFEEFRVSDGTLLKGKKLSFQIAQLIVS